MNFKLLKVAPQNGKTVAIVRCQCGNQKMIYIWSWAGHGFSKCMLCGERLLYSDFHNPTSPHRLTRKEKAIVASYAKKEGSA